MPNCREASERKIEGYTYEEWKAEATMKIQDATGLDYQTELPADMDGWLAWQHGEDPGEWADDVIGDIQANRGLG